MNFTSSNPLGCSAAGLALLLAAILPAQEQGDPGDRIEAVLTEHVDGDPAAALQKLDALLESGAEPTSTILAARSRLLIALGRHAAAADTLRRLHDQGDANWRRWAEELGEQLRRIAPATQLEFDEIPPRLRRLAEGLYDHKPLGKNQATVRDELVRIGAPAVPAILEVLPQLIGTNAEFGLTALARIGDPQAIAWLSAGLQEAADPALALDISRVLDDTRGAARAALADVALQSSNPTIRRYGLDVWPGAVGPRELEVFRENPGTAARLVALDPRGESGHQLAVWRALDPAARPAFRDALRDTEDPALIDPTLLAEVVATPQAFAIDFRTQPLWGRLRLDVRRELQPVVRKLLRAVAALPRDNTGNQNGGQVFAGEFFLEELFEDVVSFGWVDLAPEFVALLDHPDPDTQKESLNVLWRLAPATALREAVRRKQRVAISSFLAHGERDLLNAMVRLLTDELRPLQSDQWLDDHPRLLAHILDVAQAPDLDRLRPVHRALSERTSSPYRSMHDQWAAWLETHEQITTDELLSLVPASSVTVRLAAARASQKDSAALIRVLESRQAASRAATSDLIRALLRTGAESALVGAAGADLDLLEALIEHSVDRLPAWRRQFAVLPLRPDVLRMALIDPQVPTDAALVGQVLGGLLDPGAAALAPAADRVRVFLQRCPAERAEAFALQTWQGFAGRRHLQRHELLSAVPTLQVLGEDRDVAHIGIYAAALEIEVGPVQLAAVVQLQRTFSPRAVAPLLQALKSDDYQVVASARGALDRLQSYFTTRDEWSQRLDQMGLRLPVDEGPDKGR